MLRRLGPGSQLRMTGNTSELSELHELESADTVT